MKAFIFIILFFGAFLFSNAQIDASNNSFAIPAEEVEDPKKDNALNIKAKKNTNGIIPEETAKNKIVIPKPIPVSRKPKKPFSIVETNNYKNPAELYTKTLDKQLKFKEDKERSNNGSKIDQFLGEFKTKAKKVNIIYRDHGAADGDVIRILINDDIRIPSVVLTNSVSGFDLRLSEGINKIDFLALNQGLSGPNTAEFRVVDELGNIISSNQWNLSTGVKATVILIKTGGQLKLAK